MTQIAAVVETSAAAAASECPSHLLQLLAMINERLAKFIIKLVRHNPRPPTESADYIPEQTTFAIFRRSNISCARRR